MPVLRALPLRGGHAAIHFAVGGIVHLLGKISGEREWRGGAERLGIGDRGVRAEQDGQDEVESSRAGEHGSKLSARARASERVVAARPSARSNAKREAPDFLGAAPSKSGAAHDSYERAGGCAATMGALRDRSCV